MTTALRIGVALCAIHLVACSEILGLEEIVPDGSPARLSFIAPALSPVAPPPAVVQEPLSVVAVRVEDALGNRVQSPGTEIRLALGANPGGASLLGTLTAKVSSDTALFELVYLDKPGAGYTLVASADGLMPATMMIDVVPAAFTRAPTGVDGESVSGVAASPAPPGGSSTLFATASGLVFTSTNGGVSWAPPGIGGSSATSVVADPQHPGVAYAIPRGGLQRYLFQKTMDGGMTWHSATIDGANLQQFDEGTIAIAIDPTNSSILYVATYVATYPPDPTTRLHRSADGGMTWTTSSIPVRCSSIVIDRATTSNLYCTNDSDNLLRSTDSGATWRADTALDARGASLMLATPGALFVNVVGQLYRSTDHGGSWTPLSALNPGALAFAPSMPQRVYLGQGGSLLVSNDVGTSFGPAGASLPFSILQLTVDAQNPDLVYATTGGGVFRSSNAGVSWSPASTGIDATPITAVVPVPGTPGAWLASTPHSVVRTTNDGAMWTQVAQISSAQLALDPANAANVYACGDLFAASTDGGAHFGAATDSGVFCRYFVAEGNTLFASNGGILRKSIDRGVSWTDVGGIDTSTFIRGFAIGDATGSVVLVGTTAGLRRSTDGGTSFQLVSSNYVLSLFSDPHNPSHVLMGTESCALSYSTDGGSTFKTASSPRLCLSAYGAADGMLYAGGYPYFANGGNLIRSPDGG
ncbi:MAG TPA: hypothetical protein VF516_25345, partial [Kofleriaceae bacterium]